VRRLGFEVLYVRSILMGTLALLGCVLLAGVYCWDRYSAAMAIDTILGIDQAMYVTIGDTEQWVQIRGEDRKNPVLLWLNGGPGFSTIPQTYFSRELERDFTVVMWDQRGEGRSYARTGAAIGPTMSIDRMATDGIELAEFLRKHLGVGQVAILGHSWGSILGIHMAQRQPDLFSAYVGTGQVVNLREALRRSYPAINQQAREKQIEPAMKELEANGPPPYEDMEKYWVTIKWANEFDASSEASEQRLNAGALWAWFRIVAFSGRMVREGAIFSQGLMLRPMLDEDIPAAGTTFAMPMVFIQGSEDLLCPPSLVQDYMDRIAAPHKRLIVLPGAGHLAIFRDRGMFRRALRDVRPLMTLSN
jgi:pimeloyl-ACP methyl ester carboxylesterase